MDKISIIVSYRNEEENLETFVYNLEKAFKNKKITQYEIIFIDDYSSDNSLKVLLSLSKKNKKIKIIKMSKRFGHSHSIQAALENIDSKNFCTFIDCDLQDPPELIAKNLNFKDRKSTIHFIRKERNDGFFQKIYSLIAYKILNLISFGKIIQNAGYYKIVPPAVTKLLKQDNEYLPYWNYLITKHSIKSKKIFYSRKKRFKGESKFNFFSLNPWMTYFGGLYYFKYR